MLFCGEAPGASEDIIGRPFVGPAGKLLDHIILQSGLEMSNWRYAITNLVACMPKEDGKKNEPPDWAIEACSQRLMEAIEMVRPCLIVRVGKLASKKVDKDKIGISTIDMVHPASILRMDVSQKGLAVQRQVICLRDALENLVPY